MWLIRLASIGVARDDTAWYVAGFVFKLFHRVRRTEMSQGQRPFCRGN
jgi:hypothetical protein